MRTSDILESVLGTGNTAVDNADKVPALTELNMVAILDTSLRMPCKQIKMMHEKLSIDLTYSKKPKNAYQMSTEINHIFGKTQL